MESWKTVHLYLTIWMTIVASVLTSKIVRAEMPRSSPAPEGITMPRMRPPPLKQAGLEHAILVKRILSKLSSVETLPDRLAMMAALPQGVLVNQFETVRTPIQPRQCRVTNCSTGSLLLRTAQTINLSYLGYIPIQQYLVTTLGDVVLRWTSTLQKLRML